MTKFSRGLAVTFYLCFFVASSLTFTTTLQAQAPFYQGKSIRLIIGNQAGSLYDGWARLFANHMGKHIAGNPTIVGQNIPGAGSVIAANQIYNVAKPDGLTIGAPSGNLYGPAY